MSSNMSESTMPVTAPITTMLLSQPLVVSPTHISMDTSESKDIDTCEDLPSNGAVTSTMSQNVTNLHDKTSPETLTQDQAMPMDLFCSESSGAFKLVQSSIDENIIKHEGNNFWMDDATPLKKTKLADVEEGKECGDYKKCAVSPETLNRDCKIGDDASVGREKENTAGPSPLQVEEGRTLRRARKKPVQEGHVHLCPVCGVTIRPGELTSHIRWELDKVDKVSRYGRKSGVKMCASGSGKVQPCSSSGSTSSGAANAEGGSSDPGERYQAYLRVKEGRQGRLCARNRRKARQEEETTCPVCEKQVTGTQEQLTEHVELCLKKQEDEAVSVDVVGEEEDETYEEYEWAGQTRIRTTTLLPGGLAASGFQTGSKITAEEEEDIDLDVDGCDQATFGEAQYSEKDLIAPNAESRREKKQRTALRRAYLRTEVQSVQSEPSERDRWKIKAGSARSRTNSQGSEPEVEESTPSCGPEDSDAQSMAEIITSLKAKIREQEEQLGKERPKCLICMEPYHTPLTSVQCWHVHCEECWLRTLGAKKLCPQCNMITSASDLRKVYL